MASVYKAGANAKQLLLLLVVAVALSSSLLAVDGSRQPVHLRLYMHDLIGGPQRTAIRLIWGVGPAHTSMPGRSFGDTTEILHLQYHHEREWKAAGAGHASVNAEG
ncbi:hypothetical protein EJB05_40815, partial [Eragrostis curvula]